MCSVLIRPFWSFLGFLRSSWRPSRVDLVQREQPAALPAGCCWAGPVQEDPAPSASQPQCHPAQCHHCTRWRSKGSFCGGWATPGAAPALIVRVWRVQRDGDSVQEAPGDGGLQAAVHRWERESGSPWSPNTDLLLCQQTFCEWTPTGLLPDYLPVQKLWAVKEQQRL